jgi:gliding motility-associated-like protein
MFRRAIEILNQRMDFGTSIVALPGFILLFFTLLYIPFTIHAQSVITNNNAYINIENEARVSGDTIDNLAGSIRNFGYIHLSGNFNNAANALGNGFYYIGGNWNNTGSFSEGTSEVLMVGSQNQQIINPVLDRFYTLEINNDGFFPASRIYLRDNAEVTNLLRMYEGNVETGTNILYLSNPASNALDWNSGRIIGRFERGINSLSNYLFPIGAETSYNPINLDPISLNNPGSVLTEFFPDDPGDFDLPIFDDSVEVYDAHYTGYWDLRDRNGFNIAEYDIRLGHDGFDSIQPITRVLSRWADGSAWELDGRHRDADLDDARRDTLRNGIRFPGLQLGLGKSRPRIMVQPMNDTVCELDPAYFYVEARGRKLTYQWQLDTGTGWTDLGPDSTNYRGYDEDELHIDTAYLYMDGYRFRVLVTDKFGNTTTSEEALLIVEPLPRAIAIPDELVICDEGFALVELTSTLPGTEFGISVIENDSIIGATSWAPGLRDSITDQLFNVGNTVNYVTYVITPYGPGSQYCPGYNDTVTVWVNPTPRIRVEVAPDTILCNNEFVYFTSDSLVSTFGRVRYTVDVAYSSVNVNNQIATGTIGDIGTLSDSLSNTGVDVETVTYTFTPYIEDGADSGDCGGYPDTDTVITIYVNPTPRMQVAIDDSYFERCNDTLVIFNTDSLVSTTGILRYRVSADYGTSLSGNIPGTPSGQYIGMGLLTDQPVNHGFGVDSVTYTFVPYIEGATNIGDRECRKGDTVTVTLLINPTPSMKVAIWDPVIENDTIFCNYTNVFFTLTTDITSTTGDLLNDLSVSGDWEDVEGESSGTNRFISDFSDSLYHSEPDIQRLDYFFEPFIDNVMDAGCRVSIDTTVIVKIVPTLTADIQSDSATYFIGGNDVRCFGDFGSISVDPVGGDYRYFYHYDWKDGLGSTIGQTDGATGQQTPVPAGEYSLRVQDTIGCFVLDTIVLTEPDLLELDTFIFDEPLCPGQSTGTIDITVTGGIPDYDYLWRNLNIATDIRYTEDALNLGVGEYSLTVTDTNYCVYFQEFLVTAPEDIDLAIVDKSEFGSYNVQCFGDSNGSIEAGAQGGNDDFYTFTWYDANMDEIDNDGEALLDSVPAGIYYYSVIDANGCTTDPPIQVDSLIQPDSITIEKVDPAYPGGWDISCYGLSDGFIDVVYSGGHTGAQTNTYLWTGPGIDGSNLNDSIHSGMPAGTYTVRVTDYQGCTGLDTIILLEPEEIQYFSTSSKDPAVYNGRDVLCYSDSSGYVVIDSVTGGGTLTEEGIFTYIWDPVVTYPTGFTLDDPAGKDQTALVAGEYELTLTDQQTGCVMIDTIVLDTTPRLYAVLDIDTTGTVALPKNGYEIRCDGGADGTVTFSPQGGTGPYTYSWDGAPLGSTSVSDLTAGSYLLEITDINNCYSSYGIGMSSPPPLFIRYDSAYIECYDGLETIDIDPSGGPPDGGYTYAWTWDGGSSSEEDLVDVPAGTYNITLTDINRCEKDSAITLFESPELLVSLAVTSDYFGKDITCYGASDGEVTASVTGGNPGYIYTWEGIADTDPVISGLAEGWYRVDINDVYGCEVTDSIFVEQPDSISIVFDSETRDPYCSGDNSGRIGVIASGGAGSFVYSWSHDNTVIGNIADGLSEGTYSVVVSDINLCENEVSYTLESPQPLTMEVVTTMAECKDTEDGTLTVVPGGGTFPYFVQLNGIPDDGDGFFDFLGPGFYSVVLTDGNGCILRDDSVKVEAMSMSCIQIANAFTPNGDGTNDEWIIDDEGDGTSDIILYPDAELRVYNRWGELIYYTSDVLGEPWDGTYRGRLMPIDSYYYVLDLNNGDPPYTGNVTIIY